MAETVKKSRIVSGELEDDLEETLMEEFNLRLKSCMSGLDEPPEEGEQAIYENVDTTRKTNGDVNEDFLEGEREHHYENVCVNGHGNVYENVEFASGDKITNGHKAATLETDLDDADEAQQLPDPDQTGGLPATNTDQQFQLCITETHLDATERTEPCHHDDTEGGDLSSAKKRMFLSTDDTSCLLFTQTVTSPMLTPTEENIDFLRGLRRDSTQTSSTENTNSGQEKPAEDHHHSVDSQEQIEADDCVKEQTLRFLQQEQRAAEAPSEPETGTEIVRQLKAHFTPEAEARAKGPKAEDRELDQLKSLNLMKQIHIYESKSTNSGSDTKTVTSSQSTFVETTTEMKGAADENGLKKKKPKKSKKEHEKENISVCDTNKKAADEPVYNVNVKVLCRSYGNLSGAGLGGDLKTRAKSMSDVCAADCAKRFDSVLSGVSVKVLRERFNVDARTNSGKSKFSTVPRCKKLSREFHFLKSSFSKFDALQKKNILHVRSSDSAKAQEKFNGASADPSKCKACGKPVFQMELVKAERAVWHKNCFRCTECNKQLMMDSFESNEGLLYCKPHFKALFAPRAVEEDAPTGPRKHELIIRENNPVELPPDVVRASDKPDLGLEELHSLNVKERFQVFEQGNADPAADRSTSPVNVKKSPSILSKLARFQAKGMDIGVTDDSLNGIPVEESSSEAEDTDDGLEGDDADLIRAKRVQREKPFHFVQMSDVKNKWEHVNQNNKDDRREERKQELQTIRNRLFLGKQEKMKEAYQQAVMEAESKSAQKKVDDIEITDTKSIKERFERGDIEGDSKPKDNEEDMSVFESGISKKSRSIFLELDANSAKAAPLSPASPTVSQNKIRNAREAYLARQSSQDAVVRSSDQQDEVSIRTADIQDRFKFFEAYKEPEKQRKEFRITPPREGQVKSVTPERDVNRNPDVVRSDEYVEDSVVAEQSHTATKMLSKFRQMEENLTKEQTPAGLKPLKRFTPPREPLRQEANSEEEDESGSEGESDGEQDDEVDRGRMVDEDLLEAQKAARAKQLRAKFERWEASEIKREQGGGVVVLAQEIGEEEQSQIETTRSLRARFESMRETSSTAEKQSPRVVKVNRFVEPCGEQEFCGKCCEKVYPLEKTAVHGHIYHKNCFRCKECNNVLRMDSYAYNQGQIYCKTHFKRRFIAKGDYETGFGIEQRKNKWNTTLS